MKWTIKETEEPYSFYYGLYCDGNWVADFCNTKIVNTVCRILNALKYNPFKKKEIQK